ncbi:hypothetical protein B0A49_12802 [Cryomyces minteri]|uniref:Uncharacterized protein n=1 Tax=Cryomyces minteri TaxID=331657 RepID=A0A4U0VTL4_9PEZI|nr:hypothetical protein B0A49_12802 [Cryomyces minteri]
MTIDSKPAASSSLPSRSSAAPKTPSLTDTNHAPFTPSSPTLLTPSPLVSPGASFIQLLSAHAPEPSHLSPLAAPTPPKHDHLQHLSCSELAAYFDSLPPAPVNVVDYYDKDFGLKVRLGFDVSEVRHAVRTGKYGREVAARWKRGFTPLEEREAVEERVKRAEELDDISTTDESEGEGTEEDSRTRIDADEKESRIRAGSRRTAYQENDLCNSIAGGKVSKFIAEGPDGEGSDSDGSGSGRNAAAAGNPKSETATLHAGT